MKHPAVIAAFITVIVTLAIVACANRRQRPAPAHACVEAGGRFVPDRFPDEFAGWSYRCLFEGDKHE